jgi:hypothetical protein
MFYRFKDSGANFDNRSKSYVRNYERFGDSCEEFGEAPMEIRAFRNLNYEVFGE